MAAVVELPIQTLIDATNATIKKMQDEMSRQVFETVFIQYPWLRAIEWEQGTPSFCDGDPCYFRMRADPGEGLNLYANVAVPTEDGGFYADAWGNELEEWEYEGETFYPVPYYYFDYTEVGMDVKYKNAYQAIAHILNSLPESSLVAWFGDGVEVLYRYDGTHTSRSVYFE